MWSKEQNGATNRREKEMSTLRKLILKKKLHEASFFTHQMISRTVQKHVENDTRKVIASLRSNHDAVDKLVSALIAQHGNVEDLANKLLAIYCKESKGTCTAFDWDTWVLYLLRTCYIHADDILTLPKGVDIISRSMDDFLLTRVQIVHRPQVRNEPETLTVKI